MAGVGGLQHKEQPPLLPAPDAESDSEMTWTAQTKCTPASFLTGVRQEKQTRALKYEIRNIFSLIELSASCGFGGVRETHEVIF